MRILVDVGHPGQFHFHRNAIKLLEERGHEVLISARKKEILIDLIEKYDMKYRKISDQRSGLLGLSRELFERVTRLRKIVKEFKPDIMYGAGETVAIVGKITKTPNIVFTDTEHVKVAKLLAYPFTDNICTPSSFLSNLGKKQIRYNGFHELAYLHPNYFTPNPGVLESLNFDTNDKFILLRFISWEASHDFGVEGIKDKYSFVKELEKFGRVLISSEKSLGSKLDKYQIKIKPEDLHDLLYYSSLYVGEGGTMASEAAVLGTPSILINPMAKTCGTHRELKKYKLQYYFDSINDIGRLPYELLNDPKIKQIWNERKKILLQEKIDVTRYIVDLIESYEIFN